MEIKKKMETKQINKKKARDMTRNEMLKEIRDVYELESYVSNKTIINVCLQYEINKIRKIYGE